MPIKPMLCVNSVAWLPLALTFHVIGFYCRSGWRERLPEPCADWRFGAPHCGLLTDLVRHGPHTSHPGLHDRCSDDELEPVYATISEITDGMDETAATPENCKLFHGLVHVFADLAALPALDTGDGSSMASLSDSPPVLTDVPPPRRGIVPQPIPGRVDDRRPYRDDHRHPTTSPLRLYTYC